MALSKGLTRRTNRRLARLRLENPRALHGIRTGGYTIREARKIKRIDARARAKTQRSKTTPQYDPLAPLTGPREKAEMNAATRLQFGPQEAELRRSEASQQQATRDQASYYDDYKKALDEATGRVAAENAANVRASQDAVDRTFREDSAAVQTRDSEASKQAAILGRGAVHSAEGAQAVSAARSQGNQAVSGLRTRTSADDKFLELRRANAVLGKAQEVARQQAKEGVLHQKDQELQQQKGAFRVNFRQKTREGERTWAATQKEFGLKKLDINLRNKNTAADRKVEQSKVNAQKIIARMYSGANKAGARAQVRVAKLQLQKGKIDQHQYNTIKNIYEGLPNGGSGGKGKPKLQTWEKDKITNAMRVLSRNKASISEKSVWIKRMQDEGLPLRLARIAWRQYAPHAKGLTYTPGG